MRTILVVDDEKSILVFLEKLLTKHGYNVLVAGDGLEGFELMSSHAGVIDLLLTDVQMPELDGFGLAKAVAEARPETKIVFITGHPGEYHERLADKTVVPKPFDSRRLLDVIRAELEAEAPRQ